VPIACRIALRGRMVESSNDDEMCSILTPDQAAAGHVEEAVEMPQLHVDASGQPLVKRVHGKRAGKTPTDIKLVLIVLLVVVAGCLTAKVGLQASVLEKQQSQIHDLMAKLGAHPASAPIPSVAEAKPDTKVPELSGRAKEELFRLNSQCADLGKKFLDENHTHCAGKDCETSLKASKMQGGGYQTVKGDNITDLTQIAHYDTGANRCYVELTEYVINSKNSDVKLTVGLYDGQTGEKLASYGNAGSRSSAMDHWGAVNDTQHKHVYTSALNDEEDAKTYINAKMGR
jgi:hypothetical protein